MYYMTVWVYLGTFCGIESIKDVFDSIPTLTFDTAFLVIIILPVFIGFVWGCMAYKEWTFRVWSKICSWFKIYPVHFVPSSWDWKFLKAINQQDIIVYLKNGSEIRARFDA